MCKIFVAVNLHEFVCTRNYDLFVAWVVNLYKKKAKKGIVASTCVNFDPMYVFFNNYLFYNITAIIMPYS